MQQIKNKMNAKEQAIFDQKWSEEIEQAKAFLEKEGFQVYNVGSVDLLGAFNYHVKYVAELQRDKKRLQEELEQLKAKKTKAAKKAN